MAKQPNEANMSAVDIAKNHYDRLPHWATSVASEVIESVLRNPNIKDLDELKLKKTKSYKSRNGTEVKIDDLEEVAPALTWGLRNAFAAHLSAKWKSLEEYEASAET